MGYDTSFSGSFGLDRALSAKQVATLKDFADTRHDPPRDKPGIWCNWVPNEDGTAIEWNGAEKFTGYVPWIVYLIGTFLKPWGYVLNGEVEWDGEEQGDVGKIVVRDNQVSVNRGRIVYE